VYDRIVFVHDSEQFNGVLIDTLKELKTDPAIKCRDRLVGIELKSWQEETLLQPADLIAYENFKVAERKHAGVEMRLTMKKILDTEFRGGYRKALYRNGETRQIKKHSTDYSYPLA
jgi:hypothetical protein